MKNYFLEIKDQVIDTCSGLATHVFIKTFGSASISILALLIGSQRFQVVGLLLILTIFDFITAIAVTYKTGELIESRKALKTVVKIVVYCLFISSANLTESIALGTSWMADMVVSFLAITEMISIIENIGRMGYAIPKKLLNDLSKLKNHG